MKWFTRKEQGSADNEIVGLFSAAILLLVIIYAGFSIVRGIKRDNTQSELTARVLATEIKGIGSGDDKTDHYLISVQPVNKVDGVYESVGEPETIEVADSRMYSQFNSADIYFKLQNDIGAVYHFKLQGWRDGYHSEFRNIYDLTKLQDKGR